MTQQQRHPGAPKRKAPSKQKMSAIREAFDAEALIRVCEMDQDEFGQYATRTDLPMQMNHDGRFFYHQDNGSNILAVAHLDHVQHDPTANVVETAAGWLVTSGALDDRLGAYVILELLPKLGMKFDILLTTDEEMGASTAEDFFTGKQYHWIIEFDRGGTDVVMYDYETPALCDLVEASGARVGVGSFSDIACLEHLGCAAFNWGVGYEDYHSAKSHAWLEDTFRMVARFWKFHQQNGDKFLEHTPRPPRSRWGWDDDDLDDLDLIDEDELAERMERMGYSEGFYAERLAQQHNDGLLEWLEKRAMEDYEREQRERF